MEFQPKFLRKYISPPMIIQYTNWIKLTNSNTFKPKTQILLLIGIKHFLKTSKYTASPQNIRILLLTPLPRRAIIMIPSGK